MGEVKLKKGCILVSFEFLRHTANVCRTYVVLLPRFLSSSDGQTQTGPFHPVEILRNLIVSCFLFLCVVVKTGVQAVRMLNRNLYLRLPCHRHRCTQFLARRNFYLKGSLFAFWKYSIIDNHQPIFSQLGKR